MSSGISILTLADSLSPTIIVFTSDSLALYLPSPIYDATIEYSPALSNATLRLLVFARSTTYSLPPTLTITIPVAPFVTSTVIVVSIPTLISDTAVNSTSDSSLGMLNESAAYANPCFLSP